MMAKGWCLVGRDGKKKHFKEPSWLDRNAHLLGLVAWLLFSLFVATLFGAFEVIG